MGGRHAGQAGRVGGGFLGISAGVACGWWSRVCHHQQGKRATGQERWAGRLAPPKHLPAPAAEGTLLVASGVEYFG